eukprot:Gb_21554 [translate_table: standard]
MSTLRHSAKSFSRALRWKASRSITTKPSLFQQPELEPVTSPEPDSASGTSPTSQSPTSFPTPKPPLPGVPSNQGASSALYQENWRNPSNPDAIPAQSLVPIGLPGDQRLVRPAPFDQRSATRLQIFSQSLDLPNILNVFADWMTSQKWEDIKELFELWLRSLDQAGKPNKPDVNLYNHYLRANLMIGASAGELLDLVAQMEDYGIAPNTASFNLVLKAMYQARESEAAVKLMDRMIETGQDASPDEESYDLVIGLLFLVNQIDSALRYLDLTLKSGYMLSMSVFSDCVRTCVNAGRLDTLMSIIERCKAMDQNKALCPTWSLCTYISDVALQADHSKLAYYGLEFLARWMSRGKSARPPVLLYVDEGLVIAALGTAARTCSAPLLKVAWEILMRSLQQKRSPSPEAYLAKIHAFATLGELKWAFRALHELESAYGNTEAENDREIFCPFSSLNPLVRACSKGGFPTLDAVYFQLENLSRADPPYKSVAALNCIILGCSNIWDLDRAFQTFEAIEKSFELTADVHSYNALMSAFGKLRQTFEASNVFGHMTNLGVKPNEKSYSLLIDAHLVNRDPKSALAVVNDMMTAGYSPSKETLRKIRRRSVREFDVDGDQQIQDICQSLNYRMGGEGRREILFGLEYNSEYA